LHFVKLPTPLVVKQTIRGFVEQKKIGFLHQEASEMGSHDPAAAEGFGLAVEIRIPEGEAAQNLFGAGFELPTAQFGEGVERFVVFRVFEGAGGFVALDRLLNAGHFRRGRTGKFKNGFITRRS
jgi:hypothetical protein